MESTWGSGKAPRLHGSLSSTRGRLQATTNPPDIAEAPSAWMQSPPGCLAACRSAVCLELPHACCSVWW